MRAIRAATRRRSRPTSDMTKLALALVCALTAACVKPQFVSCDDGTLCPPDKACAPAGGGCVDPGQLTACANLGEGAMCSLTGIGGGVCHAGVSVVATCGNGQITAVAGTCVAGDGADGPATSSALASPSGVAVDGLGRIYIADTNNHRIRRVDQLGRITTIAGTKTAGASGNGFPAIFATLNFPHGIAVDGLGRVYIADTNNNQIRKVDENGIITLVAGTLAFGNADNVNPALATFHSPL